SCTLLMLATANLAHATAPNDFDADGVSDITRVEVGSDSSLIWKAQLTTTGASLDLGTLGAKGDQLAMAGWLNSGTQIGVVSEQVDGNGLVWSILGQGGVKVDKIFGEQGDLVVSGADFNGNGFADAAVARIVDKKVVWQVAFDLFAVDTPEVVKFEFGKPGDRVFFARVDDTGLDWAGVVGKGSRNRSMARMRNLSTGEVRKFGRLPKLASSGTRPRPIPVRQESGADLLAFEIAAKEVTRLSVFTLDGARVFQSTVAGKGVTVVGDFNAAPGYELAFQGESDSVVLNPANRLEFDAVYFGGTAVDEVNIAVLGLATDAGRDDSGGGSGGGGGSTGGSISACTSTMSWPGSHIYKTIGSEHFFDVRRNTIGIVVRPGGRGPFPSCVDAIDTQGNVVAKLGLYARGAGWEARYYAGVGCGASTPFNGAGVASRASANTGSSRIYMNFGGVCYGPIDASVCIGSKQC
ncbi:MAG: hypothetical protein ACK5Y6_04180, partial [Pseudomonadota bacterium]